MAEEGRGTCRKREWLGGDSGMAEVIGEEGESIYAPWPREGHGQNKCKWFTAIGCCVLRAMGCEEDRWQDCEDSESQIRNALGRSHQQTPNTRFRLVALTSTLSGPIGTLNRPSGR